MTSPNAEPVNPIYIAKITARKATCETTAAANHQKIATAFAPQQEALDKRMNEIATMQGSRKKKMGAFLELVSEFRDIAAPYVPCKKGCSACCYQRVIISSSEADYIYGKTGIAPKNIMPNTALSPVTAYGSHTPCRFLDAEGACSIYEARPFNCRNLVNIDEDNLLCQPENIALKAQKHPAAMGVPQLSAGPLNVLYSQIVGNDAKADIRAFFPG